MNRTLFLSVVLAVTSVGAIAQDASSPQPTRPGAQVHLGNEYLSQKDYSMAMTWFRKAADQGDAGGQNDVGWLYQNGWGVKQDYSEAMVWYRKAADQGNATAQVNLGWLYRKGYGVEPDYAQAMAWFRKAAAQDNAQARVNIGWLYEKGLGVKQDYGEAMSWYRKAADQGNIDAQDDIGDLYQNGWGVKQDYSEALTWYLGAADKGNADAQNSLGWLYENGHGVDQDYGQATAWYYRAAGQGNAPAETNIGWLYQNGFGVKQDYVQAMTWYRKAADQDNARAQANIGSLYESGLGVQQNHDEAVTWYGKAANHGGLIISSDIQPPRAIYAPDPEYSEEARKAKLMGIVVLWSVVGPDGQARDIKVTKSLGHGLDEKAIDAVKKWKFEPATKEGKPVAVQIYIEINFHLYGSQVGRVEVVGDRQGVNPASSLSPVILEAEKCWSKFADDTTLPRSIKQGQVTIQFVLSQDGRVGAVGIASSRVMTTLIAARVTASRR